MQLKLSTIETSLDTAKPSFERAFPSRPNAFKEECSYALGAIHANQQLQKCNPNDIFKAVYNVAMIGLSLHPHKKEAYLTPRYINGQASCVLMPSYIGMIKLAQETGAVNKIVAQPVYEGEKDDFRIDIIDGKEHYHHKINPFCDRSDNKIIAIYAYAQLSDGTTQYELMNREQIEAIRDNSDGWKAFKDGKAKSAIWNDHFGEMGRKTVIKRLFKYLPKINSEKLAKAIELDNADYQATMYQEGQIETLLRTSTYDERMKQDVEFRLSQGLTYDEAKDLISNLTMNQLDPIRDIGAASQKQITERTKAMVEQANIFEDKEETK